MGNKKSKPRMLGLITGAIIGVAIGFAQRSWIENNLNGEFVHVLNALTLIICSTAGYYIGRMLDKRKKLQNV